ncbi:MAG: serine hydrolase domain-containing protein [Planctomycetota bacterium]|jgi:CubicO group peptidase (beta-lactamase class C family)
MQAPSPTGALAAALLLAACSTTPTEWPTSTPADASIDAAAIEAVVADMRSGSYGNFDHFLMVRHGKLVFDERFELDYEAIMTPYDPTSHPYNYDHPDWHPYYQGSDLHTLQSVTKSVTSICIGIAMDEGFIPGGVETPAMSWFEAYEPDLSDPRRRDMTLEDLLTMRAGLEWNESIPYTDPANSCLQLEAADDWIQYVIDQPMREAPGTLFDYNSGASVLLGKIVREATGRRIDDYAREKLFEPLGITEFHWKETPQGEIDTEGGLYLRTHDLARIAQLFLQRGAWDGDQLVSEAWVTASTYPTVFDLAPDQPSQQGYGYQWWVPDHTDGDVSMYMGSGYGGQFPIVFPKLDLVIVFNAWNTRGQPEKNIWQAVIEEILPAVSPQ